MMLQRWPNFFIVGATKAGTTSLYEYIKDIPGIYMSPVKEPNYFSTTISDNSTNISVQDKQEYLQLFKDAINSDVVGEASTLYLTDPDAAKLIHQVSPNAKILISLRNPINRTFSHYLMSKRQGKTELEFSDIIKGKCDKNYYFEVIGRSIYYESVKRFIDIFGKDNIKIVIYEEWIKDPLTVVNEILHFLNISYDFTKFTPQVFNQFGIPRGKIGKWIYQNKTVRRYVKYAPPTIRKTLREKVVFKAGEKPSISSQHTKILADLYQEDVINLEKILCRKLPWKEFE